MRTFIPKKDDIEKKWWLVNAEGRILGRLASEEAGRGDQKGRLGHGPEGKARPGAVQEAQGLPRTLPPPRSPEPPGIQVLGGTLSLIQYYGTGKRKSSIARVFLRSGKGDITLFVNKRPRPFTEYFRLDAYKVIPRQPLLLTETENKFDMFLRVSGGGAKGQAEAIRLGS